MAKREPSTPGATTPADEFSLDFTGLFKLEDLKVPPPAPPVPKSVPRDLVIGAGKVAAGGYHVNLARARPKRGLDRGNTTILIVEDDAGIRTMINLLLGRIGYRTRTAGNGGEFIAAMQQKPLPDLLLLDLNLPDISGFKILSKVRGHPRLRDLPVIIFTAHTGVNELAQGIALGADGFLSKPATVSVLMEAVEAVLGG